MALKLIIGNKNYSSWSLRPWIAMKVAGIAFEEEVISLDARDFKQRVGKISGTGKVPALVDGSVHVWESLAILEYLGEKHPAAQLWPRDSQARAHARAIACEMHAGFGPLRRELPMNMQRPVMRRDLPPAVQSNVRRIEAMWADCRGRFGTDGAFLFGAFGAADAMYAPVVSRFHTYGVEVGAVGRAYMHAVRGCRRGGNGWRPRARSRGCWPRTRWTGRRFCAYDRGANAMSTPDSAALLPKKSRGGLLIRARERKKYTAIL
jgi:glutathione S-transferase